MKKLLGCAALFFLFLNCAALNPDAHGQQTRAASLPAASAPATRYEQKVLEEINRLRSNPPAYARSLMEIRNYYSGKLLSLPGQIPLETQEGISALNTAIFALKKAPKVQPLRLVPGMSRAARKHVEDIAPRGLTSHTGTDGSEPADRLNMFGRWQETAGENIQYGARNPEEVVMQLVIDDGVPNRGHRINLLHPKFKVVGISCGTHLTFRTVCVIAFAGGYAER